jgi:hypothetical protein
MELVTICRFLENCLASDILTIYFVSKMHEYPWRHGVEVVACPNGTEDRLFEYHQGGKLL